jgi:hypothetical protein
MSSPASPPPPAPRRALPVLASLLLAAGAFLLALALLVLFVWWRPFGAAPPAGLVSDPDGEPEKGFEVETRLVREHLDRQSGRVFPTVGVLRWGPHRRLTGAERGRIASSFEYRATLSMRGILPRDAAPPTAVIRCVWHGHAGGAFADGLFWVDGERLGLILKEQDTPRRRRSSFDPPQVTYGDDWMSKVPVSWTE